MKKFLLYISLSLLSLVSLSSCKSDIDNSFQATWIVVSYADPFKATMEPTIVSTGEKYILRFNDDGNFSFSTDCNTVSGEYKSEGDKLHFLNMYATEMACDREIVERCVKSQLPTVESFKLQDDTVLTLLGKDSNVLFELRKASDQE